MYEEQKRYKEASAAYLQVGEENNTCRVIRAAGVLAKQGDLVAARFSAQHRREGGRPAYQLILADAQLLREAKQHQQARSTFEALTKGDSPVLYDHAMAAEKLAKIDV
jgi:hypothetical protein